MGWGEPVFDGVWFRDDRGWDRPYPRGNIPLDSRSALSLRIEGMGHPLFTSSAPFRSLGWWTQRLELGTGSWTSPVRWQGLLDGEGSLRCGSWLSSRVPWLLPSERVAWRERCHGSFPPSGRHWLSGAMAPLSAGSTGVSGA